MANLTGATSVELKSGMESVAFDNGVTVSFEELTASDLDTTADKYLTIGSAAGAITTTAATDAAALSAIGTHAISASYTLTAELNDAGTSFTVTATGASGDVFTANTAASTLASDATETLVFTDAQGNAGFTLAFDEANSTLLTATNYETAIEGTSFLLTQDAAAVTMTDYNFEDVFGTSALNAAGTSDTGVSKSTIEVASTSNDGLTIQVGANSGDELSINIDNASAEYLGVKGLDVSTQETAAAAIDKVNDAINNVSSQRAYLGAIQNRLDYKISNLETSSQNLTSAESSIRDVDMAKEMTKFTNANILSQASTAMLAQANSLPQNVLSLIG